MKYDMKLSTPQNRRRFREELHRRTEAMDVIPYDGLSPEQHEKLMRLNATLRDVEARFHAAGLQASTSLEHRIADPTDWLTDYELEIEVDYFLREDDLDYEENDDNILMIQEEYLGKLARRGRAHKWSPDRDCREPGSSFEGERDCRLYRDLYGPCGLTWTDLLRIGTIWVDFKVIEQQCIELGP